MKISKSQFLLATTLAIAISMSTWHLAKAWASDGTWLSSTQYYRFDSSVPTSFRTYITKGANVWTNVTPSRWIWGLSTSKGMWIYYTNIDGTGGMGATTTRTYFGTIIISAYMTFDSSENWYAGTGVPGSNQVDVWSVAAHEMGHGLGLEHTSGIYCPGNTYDATMCLVTRLGSYYKRTLAGDDRNGVNALYP